MYESWWPLFVIITVYFIFFGIWLGIRAGGMLNEKTIISWCISVLAVSIYFDSIIATGAVILIMTFFVTYLISAAATNSDYAFGYALIVTLGLVGVFTFIANMSIIAYICLAVILFIVTIMIFDRIKGK